MISLEKFGNEQPFGGGRSRLSCLGELLPDVEVRRILVVDDVIRHGDVLEAAAGRARARYGDVVIDYAVMFMDTASVEAGPWRAALERTTVGEVIDSSREWIEFPWGNRALSQALTRTDHQT